MQTINLECSQLPYLQHLPKAIELKEGLNIFTAKNGRGKSTIAKELKEKHRCLLFNKNEIKTNIHQGGERLSIKDAQEQNSAKLLIECDPKAIEMAETLNEMKFTKSEKTSELKQAQKLLNEMVVAVETLNFIAKTSEERNIIIESQEDKLSTIVVEIEKLTQDLDNSKTQESKPLLQKLAFEEVKIKPVNIVCSFFAKTTIETPKTKFIKRHNAFFNELFTMDFCSEIISNDTKKQIEEIINDDTEKEIKTYV